MGYESRIYVVNVHRGLKIGESVIPTFAEKICSFNLSCMKHSFYQLFKTETDYKLFMDDGNTEFCEDKYGEHIKSASMDAVIEYLKEQISSGDNYRRLSPVLSLLEGFNRSVWDCLEVVHYGY